MKFMNFGIRKTIKRVLSLDANMEPNFATIVIESNMDKYMIMSETIAALFEALPVSIL